MPTGLTALNRWAFKSSYTLQNYSPRRLINLAGMPPTTLIGSTSRVTTDPAAITEPRPMVTPASILTYAPTQTSSSITMGANEQPCSWIGREGSRKLWLAVAKAVRCDAYAVADGDAHCWIGIANQRAIGLYAAVIAQSDAAL